MRRRVLTFLGLVGLGWLLVFIISLSIFSAWRADPRTILRIFAAATISVSAIAGIMAMILVAFGFFQPDGSSKSGASSPLIPGGIDDLAGKGKQIGSSRESDAELLQRLWVAGGVDRQAAVEEAPSPTIDAEPYPSNPDYIDRGQIEREVRASLRDFRPTAILDSGQSDGIGKTELAIQASNELASNGTFVRRLWIDCEDRAPDDIFREIFFQCDLSIPPETERKDKVAIIKNFLADKNWLIILDDLRNANASVLDELLPLPSSCAILLTGQLEHIPFGTNVFRLGAMTEAESWRLLRAKLKQSINWESEGKAISRLLARSANNPLALMVATCTIALKPPPNRQCVTDFVRSIDTAVSDLSIPSEDPRYMLFGVLEASYSWLVQEDQRRFRVLAAFDPSSFSIKSAAALWGDDFQRAIAVINRFRDLSLIMPSQSGADRFRMHHLIYEFTATKLLDSGEDAAIRTAHAAHFATLLGEANQLFIKGGDNRRLGLRILDTEFLNILAGQAWAAMHINSDKTVAEVANWYAWQATISSTRLDSTNRIRWIESGLAASEKLDDKVAQAAHLNNLGRVYSDSGNPRRSIRYYKQALALDRASGNRGGEGTALGNLGNAYAAMGEPEKAIQFYEQRLAIARETGNRRAESFALYNLAKAYATLGEPRRAIPLFEQHLLLTRKMGDRRGEQIDLGHLGSAHAAMGEMSEAIQLFENQLEIARSLSDRRAEGQALGNLANAYADLDKTLQAIDLYQKQLLIVQEIGDRHGEGVAYGNLASAYADLGETLKALRLYEIQLKIVHDIDDRRGEATVLSNLGLAHAALGQTPRAIRFYDQALAIEQRVGDKRAEGAVLGNLGNAYTDIGEPRKALIFYEQHLAIAREIGDRRGEGNALGNMGNAHLDLGEPTEAIRYHEQHLAIAREIRDRHGEGAAAGNLGLAHAALHEPHEAIRFYEQHLAIALEIGDKQAEGNALANLGNANADLGDTRSAIQFYRQALEIKREMGDRRGEALTCWNLGLAYEELGQLYEAIDVMQTCVDYERAIGHPDLEKDMAQVEAIRKKTFEPKNPLRAYISQYTAKARSIIPISRRR